MSMTTYAEWFIYFCLAFCAIGAVITLAAGVYLLWDITTELSIRMHVRITQYRVTVLRTTHVPTQDELMVMAVDAYMQRRQAMYTELATMMRDDAPMVYALHGGWDLDDSVKYTHEDMRIHATMDSTPMGEEDMQALYRYALEQ